VRASAARLADKTAGLTPAHDGFELELRGGVRIAASELPWRRLREVTYHQVDLDVGFGFADLPPRLVDAFLRDEALSLADSVEPPSVTLRPTEGSSHVIGDGAASVRGTPAALLGWLARGLTAGLVCDGGLPHLPRER